MEKSRLSLTMVEGALRLVTVFTTSVRSGASRSDNSTDEFVELRYLS